MGVQMDNLFDNFWQTIILSLLACYVVFSFSEYHMHRYLMHRKSFPDWFYEKYPLFKEIYEAHAIRHHAIWYREFDFETHPDGRYDNIEFRAFDTAVIFFFVSPLILLFFLASPLSGITFIVMLLLHNFVWNLLHSQMHLPKNVFFANWGVFRWLARHHYMHHQMTNKNYNVVLPLTDYILGTKTEPRTRDLRELLRLGYLKPRSARTQAILDKMRSEIATKRSQIILEKEQVMA